MTTARAQLSGVGSRKWAIPERYTMRCILGSGSYGTVCEALDNGTPDGQKKLVAIKRVQRLFDNLIDCKRILREVSIQSRLCHPNICKLENLLLPEGSSMETFDSLFIVMEICDTDMRQLCKKDIVLDSVCINAMMYSFLIGLRYLHSAGVWHRDLKPANCLVNQDCTVKICDFGLARTVEKDEPGELPNTPREGQNTTGEKGNVEAVGVVPTSQRAKRALTNHVVTRFYRAPELILLQPTYTEKIDTWSLGCIFAELLQLLPDGIPFEDRRPLFPGQTAYPWSPAPGHKDDCLYHTRGSREMMNIIFDCLGTPTQDEIDKLEREDSKQYISLFKKRPGSGLRSKFHYVDPSSMDLLERMLRFDARSRISDDGAIAHELFAECREPDKEKARAPAKITLEFDAEFSQPMAQTAMEKRLRELLSGEITTQAKGCGGGYESGQQLPVAPST